MCICRADIVAINIKKNQNYNNLDGHISCVLSDEVLPKGKIKADVSIFHVLI